MNQDEQFLHNLKQIVLDNLANEQFGVEHLSESIRLSRSHLHRRLKKLKGKSISQFIREVRLEKAKEMLDTENLMVSEIAYKVGFSSPSYFIKCFHDYFGYAPKEYAKYANGVSKNDYVPMVKRVMQRPLVYFLSFMVLVSLAIGIYFVFYHTNETLFLPTEKSIAVLPFKNLSEDQENQYFADGLVEDLLSRLASINEFKVISRTSSETYRNDNSKKVETIASELGVSYILEGSVRKYYNKVRVSVQLIDAKHDNHIWIKTFDRDLADIFKLQSEIALQIAEELDVVLLPENKEEIQANKTSDFTAYEDYSLGRFHWNKRTLEGFEKSINYFENAIAIDSTYGLAYSGLADTYNLMAIFGWIDKTEGRNKAVRLAKKALRLDPSLAEAHTVLASIYTYIDFNWELAEPEYLEAIKLNPNYSTAYHYYSEHLSITGRHDKARKMIDKAIELDPLSFVIRIVSTKLYIGRGEFKKALEENIHSEELQKDHPRVFKDRFIIYYYLNEYSKAYESLKTYFKVINIKLPNEFKSSYSKIKMEELIKWAIEKDNDFYHKSYKDKDFYHKAYYYAMLGDNEKALNILEGLVNTREIYPDFTYSYFFRNMHNDSRFKNLLEKMNVPWNPKSDN